MADSLAMEGSQFLESVGSEEELPLNENERQTLSDLLHTNEAFDDDGEDVFPDEQDPDEPPSPPRKPAQRKTINYGTRRDPIPLDLDDDAGVARPARRPAGKEPRASKREREEAEAPDIVHILSSQYGMSERDIAELCRATSTYLGKKDPRNRARWSEKSSQQGQWKRRGYGTNKDY